jgi:hypothetical protein
MSGVADAMDIFAAVAPAIAGSGLDSANAASAEAALADTQRKPEEPRIADTGDELADETLNTIWALEDGIAQNTGSRRAALELEMAQNLERATANFPWLEQRLSSQLQRFKANSPEVMMLDMFEKEAAAQVKRNTDELDRIKKYAEDELGMSPVGFGDEEWALEFSRRDEQVQRKVRNDQIIGAQESTQDLSIDALLDSHSDRLAGYASNTTDTFNVYQEDLSAYHLAVQDVTQPGAAETVSLWENGRKQQLANSVRADIAASQRSLGNIPSRYWDNEKYVKARAQLDTHVGMLNDLLEGIQTNNPNLTQAYELYATAQSIDFERENRDVVQMARQSKIFQPLLGEGYETFDGRGAATSHALGVISNRLVTAMIGEDIGIATSTHSGIPKTARTPENLRAEYSGDIAGVSNLIGVSAKGREGRQQAYIEDIVAKNTSQYLAMAGNDALSPERANTLLTARGKVMVALNQSGPLDESGQQVLLESFANPDILDLARLNQDLNPAAAQVLAEDLSIVATNYDTTRQNNYIDNMNQTLMKFGPFTVHHYEFLSPNFDDIENGNVSFTFDEAAAIAKVREEEPGISWTAHRTMNRKARQEAQRLGEMVSRDLKWLAHIEALHNGSNEANYEAQYDLSFGALRMPRETEDNGEN